MAFRFRGSCCDCGHMWDGLWRVFECGRVDIQRPETYRCYICPKCFVHLYVPRQLSRAAYLRWVYENATEVSRSPLLFQACELGVRVLEQSLAVIARSPLLFEACERVARIVAGASSRYLPVSIDIGSMSCADCCDPMRVGDIATNPLICPRCESRSARSLGDHDPEAVFVDYRPLDDELVRGVILHLERLAGHTSVSRSERPLAIKSAHDLISAGAQLADPLWDFDLDGELEPTSGLERDLIPGTVDNEFQPVGRYGAQTE
jgi:hypothetical protein